MARTAQARIQSVVYVLLSLVLFICQAEQYSELLAKKLMIYCSIAISHPDQVESWTFQNQLCNALTPFDHVVRTYRANDTAFAYITISHLDRHIIAAFKGSNGSVDWINHDLQSLPFHYRSKCHIGYIVLPGHVHHGFCSYYAELNKLGLGAMLAHLHRRLGYHVFLTGHSLGGSAAVVCAAHLIKQYKIYPTVYTLGEPRTGDPAFAKLLTQTHRVFRIVHKRDIVPHCAPCCGSTCQERQYCPYHHGTEIWYNNNMMRGDKYAICTQSESMQCSNRLLDFSPDQHRHYFGVSVSSICTTYDLEWEVAMDRWMRDSQGGSVALAR